MKIIASILLFSAIAFTACNKNNIPQENRTIETIVAGKQYVFRAETANPMGGTTIRLSGGYDLVIKPNQLIATLPYYGRAYRADRDFSGIRFTSTRFSYQETMGNHSVSEIMIRPADIPEIQEIQLSISPDGYANLHITSTNRQPISYHGRIEGL